MNKRDRGTAGRIVGMLHRVEDVILVGLLFLMILLAVSQILLRNLFDGGVVWGDPLLRVLVLWIGLIGAMVATRQERQIRMDVFTRYLSRGMKAVSETLVSLFAALVCLVACGYSARFVMDEYSFGGAAFASVPTWACASIIPIAFLVIGLRYLLLAFINFKRSLDLRP